MTPKPAWWPECPYPEDIFPMSREEAVKLLPEDPNIRAALSGALGRIFWNIASDTIFDRLKEMGMI
jgi:hypothetical protein